MTFKLKQGCPAFEIVDGPFAGRRYAADQVYDVLPPGEEDRFERADKATVTQITKREKLPVKGRIEDERA